MNKKVRFQVFLYAVLAVLIPFLAWSQAEEYKNEKRFPAARYVAKGEAIKSGDLGIRLFIRKIGHLWQLKIGNMEFMQYRRLAKRRNLLQI